GTDRPPRRRRVARLAHAEPAQTIPCDEIIEAVRERPRKHAQHACRTPRPPQAFDHPQAAFRLQPDAAFVEQYVALELDGIEAVVRVYRLPQRRLRGGEGKAATGAVPDHEPRPASAVNAVNARVGQRLASR